MAGTIENPSTETTEAPAPVDGAPPQAPEVVVPDDASRLCVSCAALLEEGQDWCLECGTAQPGRISAKPGWRAALVVVAVVALLAAGAVAAAYAALSSDAEYRASAPPPPAAEPIVPAPPAQTTPAPAEETPPIPAPENDTEADAPAPRDNTPDPAPSPTPAPSADTSGDSFGSGSTGTSGGSTGGGTSTEDEAPAVEKPDPVIALGPDAASTFDPYDRAGGLTGDPADAIDGRTKTAWEAPVSAADGKVDIGLLVSLEEAQEIQKVRLQAGTPGFSVALYGSKLGTPPDAAPGATKYWVKLDETIDFGTDEKLDVGGRTYRHVLLWFTDQPADTKVMIPEVALLRKVD